MKIFKLILLLSALAIIAGSCNNKQKLEEIATSSTGAELTVKTFNFPQAQNKAGDGERSQNPDNNPCDIDETNLRILFIGNSHTAGFSVDIPLQFSNLTAFNGQSISSITTVYGLGVDLVGHLNSPVTTGVINQGNWDYVILQPYSGVLNPAWAGSFNAGVPGLTNLINASSPNAKILLYQVVPYVAYGNSTYNTLQANGISLYNNMTANYTNMYTIPIGPVFTSAYMGLQGYQPTSPDELRYGQSNSFHFRDSGGFLAACTFYSAIFNNKPCIPPTMDFWFGTGSTSQVVPQYDHLSQLAYLAGRYIIHSPSLKCQFSYPLGRYPCD